MKKIFSLFVLLLSLAAAASASEWKTVRFPNVPECIFSLPSSFTALYRGIPEDSEALRKLGITAELAESQLKANSAEILIYSSDFSFTIVIGRFVDIEGFNFSEFSSEEFAAYVDYVGSEMEAKYKSMSNDSVSYQLSDVLKYHTDHARYVALFCNCRYGAKELAMVQLVNVTSGFQTIIGITLPIEDVTEEIIDTYFDIVDNLVIL